MDVADTTSAAIMTLSWHVHEHGCCRYQYIIRSYTGMGFARPSKCCALVPSMNMACTSKISQPKVSSACPRAQGRVIHESGMHTRNQSTNTPQLCPEAQGIHESHDFNMHPNSTTAITSVAIMTVTNDMKP